MTTQPRALDAFPLDVPLSELRRRTSVKWRAHDADVLPLWVAEMDVAPCPAVVDAVTAAMRDGDTGYDHGVRYAQAFTGFASGRWGWEFDPAPTRTFADVMTAIVEVIRVLTAPGDAVVVNPPVYPPFYAYPRREGRQIVEAPLGADGRLDLAVLETAFRQATGVTAHGAGPGSGRRAVYLLCHPHNPTGTVHTADELAAALDLAARYGVRVVADEVHAPFTSPRHPHVPLLTVPGAQDAIVICSASKAWNLAGLRAAIAVGGPGAIDDLRRIPEEASHGVSHIAVIAHEAALRDGVDWLDTVLAGIQDNVCLMTTLLAEHLPAVGYRRPQGTYVAWLDCRGLDSEVGTDPAGWFLREARVALNAGDPYGTGGAGHVRLNMATSQEVLIEAVSRMSAALR